jgi:hypothetical protein
MKMNTKLIAPCGMNCALCHAYLREKDKCPGCRFSDDKKPITRLKCKIKNCEIIKKNRWQRCTTICKSYPCDKLTKLDDRYMAKYGMSMIDNLNYIEKNGIRKFIGKERKKWIKGEKVLCIHDKMYYSLKNQIK